MAPVREALLAAQFALNTKPTFDPNSAVATCRIAMTDYGLFVLLPRLLQRLAADAPLMHCAVEPLAIDSFDRLAMGDLDFCLTADDLKLYGTHRPDKHIISRQMFRDDFVCVVDPDKVDITNGISLSTYRRLRHNSVVFGDGISTIVEKGWARSSFDYNVAVTAPNFAALIFMIPGTPLVATAQRRLANALAPRLGLAVVECPLSLPKLQENLMWHERSEHDPAHKYLREQLEMAVRDIDTDAS